MNLKFDIDDNEDVSVIICPDSNEDEGELHQLSCQLYINNPCREIIHRAEMGAFNHLSRRQFDIYLNKIKSLEQFFKLERPTAGLPSGPIRRINIFLFLERIINAYLNDFDDYDVVEEPEPKE